MLTRNVSLLPVQVTFSTVEETSHRPLAMYMMIIWSHRKREIGVINWLDRAAFSAFVWLIQQTTTSFFSAFFISSTIEMKPCAYGSCSWKHQQMRCCLWNCLLLDEKEWHRLSPIGNKLLPTLQVMVPVSPLPAKWTPTGRFRIADQLIVSCHFSLAHRPAAFVWKRRYKHYPPPPSQETAKCDIGDVLPATLRRTHGR